MGLTIEQHRFMREHQDEYPEGFFHWLANNQHIWKAFEEKAYIMAAVARRPRYSARTIIEVMRWNSDIQEDKPLFKLSNNMTPGLARLWMAKHGKSYPKFFAIQEVRKGNEQDERRSNQARQQHGHMGQGIQDRR